MAKKEQEEKQEQVEANTGQENEYADTATSDNPEICFSPQDVNQFLTALNEKSRLLDEMTDRYKRLQADFDNFRRRTRQEKEELSIVVAERIICELLPVVDNFERATASSTTDLNTLTTGVQMIFRQLNNSLCQLGVEPVNAVGNMFNPAEHEAVMRVEADDQPDGMVIEELQKGYKVNGRVIRPSMVKVAGNS
ncbi:nucleotide exchange factor GrpE [Sporomusa malonica]|uniref:Protein GrpE n=1 Tax=Sporomusa malonica TaxID=112901 RepID=A0A1W2D9N1_9FIRM|nr:nucleotide exchange factor GrpE [Sporomusa malonica]SMC93698.1 molecular chaperone GrpE [Sporomusa malonica]